MGVFMVYVSEEDIFEGVIVCIYKRSEQCVLDIGRFFHFIDLVDLKNRDTD